MTSGVMRASVRSRRRWRMISCPAAKLMRWVNPSMATVSPSRTNSATASCIVVVLSELIGRPSVIRPSEHAELVPLRVTHLGPEARPHIEEPERGGAECLQALDLVGHRSGGPHVGMDPVLRDLPLWHRLEVHPLGLTGGIADPRSFIV